MRRGHGLLGLSLLAMLVASCAASNETTASGGSAARTGTSEIATAQIGRDLELKTALAQAESLKLEIQSLRASATANIGGNVDAAVARIEAAFTLQMQRFNTAVQGAVGEMRAAGDINNRNLTINGMTGWQVLVGCALCMATLLTVYFFVSKTWNIRHISKQEEKTIEKIVQAVENVR